MPDIQNVLVLVFFIPFLWSGLIRGIGVLIDRSSQTPPGDAYSKFMLCLMLAPVITGICVLILNIISLTYISILPPLPAFVPEDTEVWALVSTTSQVMSTFTGKSVLTLLVVIYLAGVLWLSMRLVYQHSKLMRIVSEARVHKRVSGFEVLATTERLSPFAYFQNKIVIPSVLLQELPRDQIDMIIAHEMSHLRRRDSSYFLVLAIIDVLFWINPFIRLQTSTCRLSAEISCDADVLTKYHDARHAYASAILTTIEQLAQRQRSLQAPLFNRNHSGEFHMRITQIVKGGDKFSRSAFPKPILFMALALLPVAGMQAAVADTSVSKPEFTASPLAGKITSSFGLRTSPFDDRELQHNGTDIKAATGTPVIAPGSGVVLGTDNLPGYGLLLTIDHGDGYVTRYANLSAFKVSPGERVTAGQTVALSGNSGRSTGPHLHVEVIVDGDYVDPESIIPFGQ